MANRAGGIVELGDGILVHGLEGWTVSRTTGGHAELCCLEAGKQGRHLDN